jgi:peptidoglycan/xylan/chitin deacetylase (PgdA/CDA1 family)
MKLPILMYHYVRPNSARMSERHHVLDLGLFEQQLDVMAQKFEFILGNDLLAVGDDTSALENNIWLTFDDGYRDCIDYVLPSLLKRKATATIFIPTEAIFERKLLDVTKIHLLLSTVENVGDIISASRQYYSDVNFESVVGKSFDQLYKEYGVPNVYNDSDNHFVKNLFQKLSPISVRKQFLDHVFKLFVSRSESSWVDEIYMSPDDVSYLAENGIEFGTHGHSHEWLANLPTEDQVFELTKSFQFLDTVTDSRTNRLIAYPFGSYSETTLNIARSLGVQIGVVHRGAKLAQLEFDLSGHLELDRIDIMFFDQFMSMDFD